MMKSTALFFGVLFGLSLLVSGAMLVTATMKPQWFMLGAKEAKADSLQSGAKKDSPAAAAARSDSAAILPGTAALKGDSAVVTPGGSASAAQASAAAAAQASADTDTVKQQELQNLVKLYDAMKPEDAAKILAKQPDKDVRAVILRLKKKQAAKILSYFNADRAAQVLAQ